VTVAELIDKLLQLPPEMIVYRDVEGECKTIREPMIADLHTWSAGGSISVDYLPECDADEDEAKFKGVIIE
jgi:hypothetical protein